MNYVLLGHGGLEVEPVTVPPDMEIVAIPQGTRVHFYSDAGQGLWYGQEELDVWEQLQTPWPPLDSRNVTYNLTLRNAPEAWDSLLENEPAFGGNTLVRPGFDGLPGSIPLCTGTRRTCPTDPRQVAAGARHTCDGVLGRYGGDLYWVSCTSFDGAEQGLVDAVLAGRPTDVTLGDDPDWVPDESAHQAIAAVNGAHVSAAHEEAPLPFVAGGTVLLIGAGHASRHVNYAACHEDYYEGVVIVFKESAFFPGGALVAQHVPPDEWERARSALERLSNGADIQFLG